MPSHHSVRTHADTALTQRRPLRLIAAVLFAFVVAGVAATGEDPGLRATVAGPSAAVAAPAAAPAQAPATAAPTTAQIESARRYAMARRGVVSFAVTGTDGRLRGLRTTRRYWSASVIKAMLLVAYLERLDRRDQPLRASDRALLGPMIRRSDNATTNRVYVAVGNAGLDVVARRAGMTRFRPSPQWGGSLITAQDQARYFRRIDRLAPERTRAYARRLLQTIVPSQRWGVPQAVPAGTKVLFKGGWRSGHGGRIVNQVAKLERDGRVISVAILTDGNPSHDYGTESVRGVAARLLR